MTKEIMTLPKCNSTFKLQQNKDGHHVLDKDRCNNNADNSIQAVFFRTKIWRNFLLGQSFTYSQQWNRHEEQIIACMGQSKAKDTSVRNTDGYHANTHTQKDHEPLDKNNSHLDRNHAKKHSNYTLPRDYHPFECTRIVLTITMFSCSNLC